MNTTTISLFAAVALVAGLALAAPTSANAAHTCHGERATLVGTDHPDTLTGTRHRDVIIGLGGNDRIRGLGGDDVICGGRGNDRINGGRGSDQLNGDAGNDRIVTGPGPHDVVLGGAGNDYLRATGTFADLIGDAGKDVLVSTRPGADLFGGAGDDLLVGSRYADRMYGGPDDDHLTGNAGNDRAWGADGSDLVYGGAGNDRLDGGAGTDLCSGGSGRDTCNGGTPGSSANTPTDPDQCTAENQLSCHGAASYTGTASGTLVRNGVTETWTATYTLTPFVPGTYQGVARFTWHISGTASNGCSYFGQANFNGTASLSDFGKQYAHELHPSRAEQVDVTETCPDTGARTVPLWPLDADAASSDLVTGAPGQGSRRYHPNGDPAVTTVWSWHISS